MCKDYNFYIPIYKYTAKLIEENAGNYRVLNAFNLKFLSVTSDVKSYKSSTLPLCYTILVYSSGKKQIAKQQ